MENVGKKWKTTWFCPRDTNLSAPLHRIIQRYAPKGNEGVIALYAMRFHQKVVKLRMYILPEVEVET